MTVDSQLNDLLASAHADSVDAVLSITLLRAADGKIIFESAGAARHYAASTMKVPLVLAAFRSAERGELDLDAEHAVHNEFTSAVGGTFGIDEDDDSDPEVWAAIGHKVSLRWLCRRSIIRSSNLATNLVLEAVGIPAVAEALEHTGTEDQLQVIRGIGDFAAQRAGGSNLITTAGLAKLLRSLHLGTAATPTSCEAIVEILACNEIDTDLRAGLPAGTWVAHKNGWVTGIVHDAGLIKPADTTPFILAVATTTEWGNDRAHRFIADATRIAWSHRSAF